MEKASILRVGKTLDTALRHRRKFIKNFFMHFLPVALLVLGMIGLAAHFGLVTIAALPLDEGNNSFIISGVLVVTSVFFWIIFQMIENDPFTGTNFAVERQVERISDLLALAEKNVVVFSGELNHSVYEDPTVLEAFRRLGSQTSVHLFIENDTIDPESTQMSALIKERGWILEQVPFTAKHHFTVVDCRDLRIEHRRKDNSGPQYARYLKARPDLARKILGDFKRSIVFFDPSFNSDLLTF